MNYDLTNKENRINHSETFCKNMNEEIELDNWFFNLPAAWQMDITAIYINEAVATDDDYEKFNNAVTEWWDSQDYDDKLIIYKNELRFN